MDGPKLPVELLLEILRWSMLTRSLKRILRLRLVNKTFAAEVIKLLPGHPLLSALPLSYTTKYPPQSLESARLVHYLKTGTEEEYTRHLLIIKDVAIALSEADTRGRSVDEFLSQLCSLAVTKYRYGRIFMPYIFWDTHSGMKTYPPFETELFVAALHTQTSPVVIALLQKSPGLWTDAYSHLFGNAYEHAVAHADNLPLVNAVLQSVYCTENTRRAFLRYAAEHGDLDLVRLIWNSNTDKFPWVFAQFPREDYEGHRNNRLLAKMHTPSRQIFEFLMEKRHKHCIGKIFGAEQWTQFLARCAAEGWIEMAKHYMELGAAINGIDNTNTDDGTLSKEKYRHYPRSSHPLLVAVRQRRRDVVELLLAHGAQIDGCALETAITEGNLEIVKVLLDSGAEVTSVAVTVAARRGYMLTARTLIERCVDVGSVAQELLVHAVRLEDEGLLRFLVSFAGSVVAKEAYDQCRTACEEDGLESMERRLSELQQAVLAQE
ncbi:hypothetical protein DE146DRAFT_648989 [Phaeosphaeria sp. MPI-PUGE-AT-0046c]|nr:hypothetical protein DE146DRAFT_648989 [Phaeosphaeria sp. MPI-PUGE-AT-0046c]